MRPRTAVAVLAAGLIAIGAAGCGGSDKAGGASKADTTVLTLANGNGDSHSLEPFAQAVARLSGGTLRIEFRNDWREGAPDYETGVIGDVAAGKADLGWAGSRAFDDVDVPAFDALHAPLLIDSYPLERKVLESPMTTAMLEGLEPLGLVGVGVLPGPMRKPLGVARLVGPEDYSGATIAYQRSQVAAQTLDALGARGAEIPSAGSIASYDGVEQQIGAIAGNGYDKVATYLAANVNLWPRPVVLFMDREAYETLDDRQRGALRAAARAAIAPSLAQEQADDEEGVGILCRRGVTFVTAADRDLDALRKAVQPVYDSLARHAPTKAAIAQILAMRSQTASPPDAPECTEQAPDVVASANAAPIDGVYRSDITLDELSRTPGYKDFEDHPGNVGHFRMELDKGRFAVTGSSDGVDQHGTYTVDGDTLTFQWNNEGSFTYKWSLYRGALTLRKTGDGPTIFAVHPWRATGDETAVGERTPIDGVYTLTTTREESTEPETIDSENYGRWRFVFSRGRLRYTQASEGYSRWTEATYEVDDDKLTIEVTDYGGEAPNGAAEKTGEVFTYRWSLFRDQLTLAAVAGAVSPANLLVRPLRRVGDAP